MPPPSQDIAGNDIAPLLQAIASFLPSQIIPFLPSRPNHQLGSAEDVGERDHFGNSLR
jgi:hypothetical protein